MRGVLLRRLRGALIPLGFAAAPPALPAQHPAPGGAPAGPRYTAADVQFMQHMIVHHAQALEMAGLVPARTASGAIRLLAQRIEISQRDEIALMRRWLEARGEAAPDPAGHAHHGGAASAPMPGMLSAADLARLAAARGAAFDRLFVELMIRHHEGALLMVKQLFATPGAGQEAAVFRFASDVDTDQRAEIARMRSLLQSLPPTPGPSDSERSPSGRS